MHCATVSVMGYLLMSHPDQTIIMLIILGYDVIFQGQIREHGGL